MLNIVLILICVIIFLVILYRLYLDIVLSRAYKNATVTRGRVIEKLDDYTLTVWGNGAVFKTQIRRYKQYKVEYYVDGVKYVGNAIIKNVELIPGDTMEIRYYIGKKSGKPVIALPCYWDRLKELLIVLVILVILLVSAYIVYKAKGGMF